MSLIIKNQAFEFLGRTGLISKGVTYTLLGLIALFSAFKIGGKRADDASRDGVLKAIQDLPAGKIILILLVIGLVCYTVWRFIQSIADTEHKGSRAKGLGARFRYLFSGLIYLSFAIAAFKLLINNKSDGKNSNEEMTNQLLHQPFGQWLVIIVGGILAIVGIYQCYYGLSEKYKKHISKLNLHTRQSNLIITAGIIGYIARGIVWLVLSYMMIRAAIESNAKKAGDTGEAVEFISQSSYGSLLLVTLAAGLILYGVFNFIRAKYDRITLY